MIYKIAELLYRSFLGMPLSYLSRIALFYSRPTMMYGFRDPKTKTFRKYTRISNTALILSKNRISIKDKIWIGHGSILDATNNITIGKCVQISNWVGLFTHSSSNSIRLLGDDYININYKKRIGYIRGDISIGDYSYIGSKSIIFPGVQIGKGCVIGAGSIVTKDVPDFSVVIGSPAKVVSTTIEIDKKLLNQIDDHSSYYDKKILKLIKKSYNKI